MSQPTRQINGVLLPPFLYGTAWKEEGTQRLTELALGQGFRGIDTANQRRHYHEAAVGAGIAAAMASGAISRNELFLQTKFTFQAGQDHRLPYDPHAPIAAQVAQSFARSLEHLGTAQLDSYVLHGPSQRVGLGPDDWEAWQAMEELQFDGKTKLLGVSNVSLEQLQLLCDKARVKPSFVQNRCYAIRQWDRPIREFCAAQGLIFQGFSLLTANRDVLQSRQLAEIAKRHGRSVQQIVFRFAIEVGMLPLTGTTNPEHMQQDLEIFDFMLEPTETRIIEMLAVS
jgi:diketogulonate reductase-like aldo/keto reductase